MEARADLVIVGGGTGGCAAALAALSNGLSVVLAEEFSWIGGQFTSQGVPPDEHGWIEKFGCTRRYRAFRNAIREHYRRYYPLTESARLHPALNPGNGWVSPLCHEPRVSHGVLRAFLSPFEAAGRLRIFTGARAIRADVEQDAVRSVDVTYEGMNINLAGSWFIDGTELGDLLPLTGCEFVTGAEAQGQTGEPSAPYVPAPENVQAFSWCFAMEHLEGEDHRISRPARYSYWRDYVPRLEPAWPGELFSWTTPNPRTMQPNNYRFEPHREEPKAFSGLWSYRRLLDRSLFKEGLFRSDISLVNWPLIDYLDGDLCTASPEGRERYLAEAREMSLCMFYWMQTEAPRPDGGAGWPGLRLCGSALGTADGLAQAPYIRESRRILAKQTITEQDVSAESNPGETLGRRYDNSVGIGSYRIDLHPSTGGDNYLDVASLPFEIPLGALVPRRMRNLLPACKNLGTTHITNGCYRLHPVEWNIGEAAGLLAAYCTHNNLEPHAVLHAVEPFQTVLTAEGIELHWPPGLSLPEGDAHIHAQ